ncbi:alpha-ketoglutarate-dependent dioxygenase AlkB [Aridibaculum aurantiacum]|uniref:alpha-ketoglutarate-dependent dioxygenase AlkB n=1 Tax=Aridibaculum aurantiacum TaxID=2810307 RepID=UPI001A964E2A|nr:alpha-ketoglutarate-dependent dioxygenase AlkB [Aridibaculum aurantiacum]
MLTLFPVEPIYPAGFSYTPNFISQSEEEHLLEVAKQIPLHNMQFKEYVANRRVASFGYDYSFDNGRLTQGKEIPAEFQFLVKKVTDYLQLPSTAIAELLVTEYQPGTVINWHRDAPPFGLIAGISLLSSCNFRLRPHEKEKQSRANTISLTVEPRSLYVMDGEARTAWQHSISPVKSTRYSITLRTLKDT